MADRSRSDDTGAAVVEYLLVAVLLIVVFLAIVQVALLIHARDVLTADAAEGARSAALRGGGLETGERTCADLVRKSLSHLVTGGQGPCSAGYDGDAPRVVRMRVRATMPMTLVPFGHVHLDVAARAMVEPVP